MNIEYLEYLPFFLYLFNVIDKQCLVGYIFGVWLSTRRDLKPYVTFVESNLITLGNNVTQVREKEGTFNFMRNYFN